jgi:Pentapeptide repeats (8 copies)
MKCSNGHKISDDSWFCSTCGERAGKTKTASVEPPLSPKKGGRWDINISHWRLWSGGHKLKVVTLAVLVVVAVGSTVSQMGTTITVHGYRIMPEAELTGADLHGADLHGADLSSSHMGSANLERANLTGANLSGAYMETADLWGANLRGADLTITDLNYATLSGANLSGANLSGANLLGANLSGANLTGANLYDGTTSTGADLSGADLHGATCPNGVVYGEPGANCQTGTTYPTTVPETVPETVPTTVPVTVPIASGWVHGKFSSPWGEFISAWSDIERVWAGYGGYKSRTVISDWAIENIDVLVGNIPTDSPDAKLNETVFNLQMDISVFTRLGSDSSDIKQVEDRIKKIRQLAGGI